LGNLRYRRHPEVPRFHQRDEGSRMDYLQSNNMVESWYARSLARLKNAVLRDDAIDGVAR
jgi:hypothetical protein